MANANLTLPIGVGMAGANPLLTGSLAAGIATVENLTPAYQLAKQYPFAFIADAETSASRQRGTAALFADGPGLTEGAMRLDKPDAVQQMLGATAAAAYRLDVTPVAPHAVQEVFPGPFIKDDDSIGFIAKRVIENVIMAKVDPSVMRGRLLDEIEFLKNDPEQNHGDPYGALLDLAYRLAYYRWGVSPELGLNALKTILRELKAIPAADAKWDADNWRARFDKLQRLVEYVGWAKMKVNYSLNSWASFHSTKVKRFIPIAKDMAYILSSYARILNDTVDQLRADAALHGETKALLQDVPIAIAAALGAEELYKYDANFGMAELMDGRAKSLAKHLEGVDSENLHQSQFLRYYLLERLRSFDQAPEGSWQVVAGMPGLSKRIARAIVGAGPTWLAAAVGMEFYKALDDHNQHFEANVARTEISVLATKTLAGARWLGLDATTHTLLHNEAVLISNMSAGESSKLIRDKIRKEGAGFLPAYLEAMSSEKEIGPEKTVEIIHAMAFDLAFVSNKNFIVMPTYRAMFEELARLVKAGRVPAVKAYRVNMMATPDRRLDSCLYKAIAMAEADDQSRASSLESAKILYAAAQLIYLGDTDHRLGKYYPHKYLSHASRLLNYVIGSNNKRSAEAKRVLEKLQALVAETSGIYGFDAPRSHLSPSADLDGRIRAFVEDMVSLPEPQQTVEGMVRQLNEAIGDGLIGGQQVAVLNGVSAAVEKSGISDATADILLAAIHTVYFRVCDENPGLEIALRYASQPIRRANERTDAAAPLRERKEPAAMHGWNGVLMGAGVMQREAEKAATGSIWARLASSLFNKSGKIN